MIYATTINTTDKHICAECTKWELGDTWGTGSGKHGVMVESKGWCMLKKNKRKRWNYCKACDCFDERKITSFMCTGQGNPTPEDVEFIVENTDKLLNDGKL